jgi:hypothetical protein
MHTKDTIDKSGISGIAIQQSLFVISALMKQEARPFVTPISLSAKAPSLAWFHQVGAAVCKQAAGSISTPSCLRMGGRHYN